MSKVINFQNISVVYPNGTRALEDVSFSVSEGECFAIVGESGCGKTTLARAALGILPFGTKISGSIKVKNDEILSAKANFLRSVRGLVVGFVAQDPFSACNPVKTVEDFVSEAWRVHSLVPPKNAVENSLENLGIENARLKIRQYPFEWSGGMLQRASIAAAAAHAPPIIIADEPTSALDAELNKAVLDALKKTETAILLISHNLSLVEKYADRIAVMKDGKIIETGTAREIFENPQHQYTQQLLAVSKVRIKPPKQITENAELVLRAENLSHYYASNTVFENLNFEVREGEIIGICGPSGCGKTTLLRLLMTAEKPTSGKIFLNGKVQTKPLRNGFVMPIFQDAAASLDSRWKIWRIVTEPLTAKHRKRKFSKAERRKIAAEKLREAGLENINLEARPKNLSGGQCQRLAIVRALIAEAKIILADEPTSSLDALTSEKIMRLLSKIAENGTAVVIVSHDLELLQRWCHRIFLMRKSNDT